MTAESGRTLMQPVLLRLLGATPDGSALARRILALGSRVERFAAKTDLQTEGEPVRRPRYLVSGWACRFRLLSDGRRQIVGLVLPGDGIGVAARPSPLTSLSITALTPVLVVDAANLFPPRWSETCPELLRAVQAQADADERCINRQIVRLGQMTAIERMSDLLLELEQRLAVVGQVENDGYRLPLTHEALADTTGLSVVHVTRVFKRLRKQGLASLERGLLTLIDRQALALMADWRCEPTKSAHSAGDGRPEAPTSALERAAQPGVGRAPLFSLPRSAAFSGGGRVGGRRRDYTE